MYSQIMIHLWSNCQEISYTGGSRLSQIFGEHENLPSLSVIQLIYIKLYKEKEKKNRQKIWAKWESAFTAVRFKWDPFVHVWQKSQTTFSESHACITLY